MTINPPATCRACGRTWRAEAVREQCPFCEVTRLRAVVGQFGSRAAAVITEFGGRISGVMQRAVRLPPGEIAAFHRLTTDQAIEIGHACIDAKYAMEAAILEAAKGAGTNG